MRTSSSCHRAVQKTAIRPTFPKVARWGACIALTSGVVGCEEFPVALDVQGEAVTSEDADQVDIVVTLTSRPVGSVLVRAVSSDETEGQVSGAVRFNASNWDIPQVITVRGVDDETDDGDVDYQVSVYASRGGAKGRAELIEVIDFVNLDDEVATFQGLGDLPGGAVATYARDVSAAGDVVVGWSVGPDGDEAIRWTPEAGLEGLGGPESQAHAVSPDGTLIGGTIAEESHEGGRAAVLWRDDQPYEILIGPDYFPGGPRLMWIIDAGAVLDDGRVFGTCIQNLAYGEHIACVYDGPGDAMFVPGSEIYEADAAGNYAGTTFPERHAPQFSHAMLNGSPLPYPADAFCDFTTLCRAEARDFSADLSIVVGTASLPAADEPPGSPLLPTAILYTVEQGTVRLPDLPGGDDASGAYAVSADGSLIGGFGTDETGRTATLWIEGVPVPLEDVLEQAGGSVPEGWSLLEVRALSSDGLVIVGDATNPEGDPEAFRIVLPSAP